jgi:hypothetical protein
LSLHPISVYAWLTSLVGSHFARVDVLREYTLVPGVFSFVSDGEVRVQTCPVSHKDTPSPPRPQGETRGTGLAYMGALRRVTSRAHGERLASDRTLPLDTQVVTIIDRGSYVDPPHRMDIH